MHLYLLRHGDALETGYTDTERPLSPLGEQQAAMVAQRLQSQHIVLELILSSPLVRAKQMTDIIRKALNITEQQTTEHLLPASSERKLINLLNDIEKQTLLLVGHEPQLREFISFLTGRPQYQRIELKKASLAYIYTPTPIEPCSGILKWILPYDQMKTSMK